MKKICVITGSRAEYGILKPIISKLDISKEFILQLLVTGMHLSPEFGLTYKEIEQDGFQITEKIEVLMSSDTPVGIGKAMGLGMISFSEVFSRIKPDLIIVLGDRYEIFAAASAAMVARIPIAHLHGGELTEGLIDEAIRHSITKMSQIHFTSTERYRQRVIQLGEQPNNVFNVGALGIENIKSVKLMSKNEMEKFLGMKLVGPIALVTFHPVTLEESSAKVQFQELLDAISKMKNLKVIFTKANADTDGRIINEMIDEYTYSNSERCVAFTSMGQQKYLSALQYVDIVIGNSSSGIIEVPSFCIPTVDIGDRQKGRIYADSVIHCESSEDEIIRAVKKGLSAEFRETIKEVLNPYEKQGTSNLIIEHIQSYLQDNKGTKKKFYDL